MISHRPKRLLFVCLGNICRSPLAECVFRHETRLREVEHLFEIDSAGTSGYHIGCSPDERSVQNARNRGIEVTGTSRKLVPDDLTAFDYVIAMDRENLREIQLLSAQASGTANVHLLREWDPEGSGDVPDPYYGGATGFDEVHDIVERCCTALLGDLLQRDLDT